MNKFTTNKTVPPLSLSTIMLMLGLLIAGVLGTNNAHSAWFERLVPQGETYTVTDVDRDVAFVIDDFIYDARKFCYLAVGDRVVFFEGQHGIDYHATIYDLDSREHCELLLRDRL